MFYERPTIDLKAAPTRQSARTRGPRITFRTERPFIIGLACTFAIFTYVHYCKYSSLPPNGTVCMF